jgi:hypothetical protein
MPNGSAYRYTTKTIERRFAQLGCQDGHDAVVVTKWFDPTSQWTWYVTEYDPSDGRCFGLVVGHEVELGYFSLEEISSVRVRFGLRIERDLWWREMKLSEVRAKIDAGCAP